MDTAPDVTELDVLTDEELARVVGGADVSKFNAQHEVNSRLGMCGCGLAH
jgi:bacteriocin-like protein